MDDLIDTLIEVPRERLLATLEPRMRAGLAWRDLQAAVFHAGIREVRPRPVGFKLHCVMVVESLFQIGEAGGERDGWLAALWNADDFKKSQARDVREGDWRLTALAEVSVSPGTDPEGILRELRTALVEGDSERAEHAVLVAARELDARPLFEELWAASLRSFSNLGHKPIFCSHVTRVLERTGDARAEPALRSLVYGLTDRGSDEHLQEHAASLAAAAELPGDWDAGEPDPDASRELARKLRPASPSAARELVVEALLSGLHPTSVWDGLRLVAADLFARRPGLLPVHPTTVTSALHFIHSNTRREETRRVALLQATSWLPLFREALDLSDQAGGIDPLIEASDADPEATLDLDEVFEAPEPLRTAAFLRGRGATDAFARALRNVLLERGAREHHEPKYAAALLEDARTADPRWHAALLSTSLAYLPTRASATTEFAAESAALLDRLGKRAR